MAPKLLRHALTIGTGIILTATTFTGVGWWRRSEDVKWCRQAVAGDMAADGQPMKLELLEEVRSACAIQRTRQRLIFGALWRRGGQETARCGFELARMQLLSYQDQSLDRAVLQRFGLDDATFDLSNRENQNRFVKACLAARTRAG